MVDEIFPTIPPAEQSEELSWAHKVAAINAAFQESQLPYAFGGAIAMNYHREPRATSDIDVNIFLSPADQEGALGALRQLYGLPDEERVRREIVASGQARSLWTTTYIDLFFANTDFHESMAQRVSHEPFGDTVIPVLSIEDLIVCKAVFDRPKDWIDIDAVVKSGRKPLDLAYMISWLDKFKMTPEDNSRIDRLQTLVTQQSAL
ncbi:MAG: hypothetical protein JWO41_455 [Candidatus Saccharibacteria bacterium]|nr:hypothetical protein [Candidatus Saccharibacteria bacterium]